MGARSLPGALWALGFASIAVLGSVGTSDAADRAIVRKEGSLVVFHIPAQPLASALEAYGAATGFAVFYDAALATGHRSLGVKGSLTPARGLEALLRGTGYAPQAIGPGALTIAPASRHATGPPSIQKRPADRYDAYFATLQARLGGELCRDDRAESGGSEIIFKFWLAPSGVVARAEIIASGGDPERDRAIAERLEGLDVGEPPPAGLPTPITMAVFPPKPAEARGCAEREAGRRP